MSLINKMLQDLDARHAQPGAAPAEKLWHGPRREPRLAWRAIALGLLALVVLVLFVFFALPFLRRPAAPVTPVATVASPSQVRAAKPNVVQLASAPLAPVTASVTQVPATAPNASPVDAGAVSAAPAVEAVAPSTAMGPPLPPAPTAPTRRSARVAADGVAARPGKSAAARHAQAEARADAGTGRKSPLPKTGQPARKAAAEPRLAAGGSTSATAAPGGREMTPAQRAENDYRRALDGLQEGRVAEAVSSLQQALTIYPRHQAARETLVRLLLENNRPDEAMRQMELGLGLDANQPALAMLLARLQVERGGPAIETLTRTLPYVADSADGNYQAFLAGLLQRAQRNRESAEHYQLALRKSPQNGVWWMGLGIALQADKRLPEARDAFGRAKASGALTPELQVFVERRLQQLAASPAP
jgi:MSHA biogenesis protein MshN